MPLGAAVAGVPQIGLIGFQELMPNGFNFFNSKGAYPLYSGTLLAASAAALYKGSF